MNMGKSDNLKCQRGVVLSFCALTETDSKENESLIVFPGWTKPQVRWKYYNCDYGI